MPTELEERLRSDLRARQAQAPVPPTDLADRVRRRHRSQRRAQALTAVAVAVVVAVFAGAASLVPALRPDRRSDTADRPSQGAGILGWPTRGSLAGNTEWVDAVRGLDWHVPAEIAAEVPDSPADTRHVAFAGDVPGGRVALVAGEDDGHVVAAWFAGPSGAEPDDMEVVDLPRSVGRTDALALVQAASPTAPTVLLVAVGPPGSSLDVTAPPGVDAAGGEVRARVDLPTEDGVAVYTLHGSWTLASEVRSRVGAGRPTIVMPTVAIAGDPDGTPPTGEDGQVSADFVIDQTVARLLAEYALTEEQARPTVLASGPGKISDVALLGLTFPSDATGVWLLTYEAGVGGWSSSLGRLPYAPAGTPLEQRLVAVPVSGFQFAVHAPEGAVRAEVLTADGDELGSVDLVDGSYIGEVPGRAFAPSTDGAARVRALDSSGRTVAEGPIERVVSN